MVRIDNMKIEQLSVDKVHVRLTEEDLRSMDMTPEKFLSDSGSMHGFIMSILHEIYETTDFNPFSGSLTMEAMPDGDGMSIMLTKGIRRHEEAAPSPQEAIRRIAQILGIDRDKVRKPPRIRSVKAIRNDTVQGHRVFTFAEFEDLSMALERAEEKTLASCSLYKLDGRYSLIVPVMTRTLDDIALLMEFSESTRSGLNYLHVIEHGELVAEKDDLRSMAEGIKKLHKI